MGAPAGRTPLTVIGGFLGAGKTTLLNRLLRDPQGRRFAVLVNDFGSVDIDGRFVAEHGGRTVTLANGCVCCSVGDGFVAALCAILDSGERFDGIVVETSGVADPGRTADLARVDPALEPGGVVVVVDAETVRERAADRLVADTLLRQLAAAELLVVNKTDLVSAVERADLAVWLAGCAPEAARVEAVRCELPLEALVGPSLRPARPAGGAGPSAEDGFRRFAWSSPHPLSRVALAAALRTPPRGLLRAKGFLRLDLPADRRTVFQMVGRRWELSDGAAWGIEFPGSQVVAIGTLDMPGEAEMSAWLDTVAAASPAAGVASHLAR